MKYQVQISYTNPSHEHVTLRRRVETVTRLVEASTEGEALNRAANQQRALGFRIQEAKVLQPLQPISLKEEVEQVDEAPRARSRNVKSKPVLHKGKAIGETGIDTKTYRSPGQGEWYAIHHKSDMNTLGFHSREEAEAEVRAAHRFYGSVKEEVEQVDEANMQFDADKRDAGYKMSPAVRKAQGESDRLSKVVKPVQAGTLAAQRRRAEMKKEAVEPGETRVVNKAVKTSKKATKAAEKMVSAAKGKLNKINVKPTMDLTGQEKTHSKA